MSSVIAAGPEWNAIGVTAPDTGITDPQVAKLYGLLRGRRIPVLPHQPNVNRNQFHHGSCINGDDHAGWIAHLCNYYVVVHPPSDPKKRAYSYFDRLEPEKDYLRRDRDIVDAADYMVTLAIRPEPPLNAKRPGGVWYTTRYAFKVGKPGVIIWADGEVETYADYLRRVPR